MSGQMGGGRPAAGAGAGAGAPTLIERLAARATRAVPADVRARARLHLADWAACVAGARAEPLAGIAARAAADPLRRAAFLGSVVEMDDVDRSGRVHPGPVVWPAALLAARDHPGVAMATLLDAGVAGYEAAVGVARMLDEWHYARFHPTHGAGRFGAAAAAARVAAFDPCAMAHALAIAGSSAGAVWQVRHEAATSKAFHLADAVAGGLMAAQCAAAGMTGPMALLEGPQGLFAAMARQPRPLPQPAGWLMAEVSFKPWPACRHAHPAIDAALALPRAALADGPILVRTYSDALAFCDRPDPADPEAARFSLQHCVAVVAVRGAPTLADFAPEALADATLAAARARVAVAADAEAEARYPDHYGATVAAGGLSASVTDALGDPERPVGAAEIAAKFEALAAWGGADADVIAHALATLMHAPDDAPAAAVAVLLSDLLA